MHPNSPPTISLPAKGVFLSVLRLCVTRQRVVHYVLFIHSSELRRLRQNHTRRRPRNTRVGVLWYVFEGATCVLFAALAFRIGVVFSCEREPFIDQKNLQIIVRV